VAYLYILSGPHMNYIFNSAPWRMDLYVCLAKAFRLRAAPYVLRLCLLDTGHGAGKTKC
jgi:hypothetical protein